MDKNDVIITQIEDLRSHSLQIDPILNSYLENIKKRKIIINEEIDDSIIEMAVLPLLEMDSDGTNAPITIYLNTPGGSVYSGFVLCDVISKLKTPTTLQVLGYACSMGALICAAGVKNPNVNVICSKYSVFLIHDGSDYITGTSGQVKDRAAFNNEYNKLITEFMLNNLTISQDEYAAMERKEWWMTAKEAKRIGLVNEII